jgi:Thioesterase-like superfamily
VLESLFRPEGDRWVPHPLTRGPWSPTAMHGGPVAALLARTAEQVPMPSPMHPARFTLELLRPVPLAPLQATATVLRPGRKVQWVSASLHAGAVEVARATLLRIRTEALPWPDVVAGGPVGLSIPGPDPDAKVTAGFTAQDAPAYHNQVTEHRVVRGSWTEIGPIIDWIRLRYPVVPDEAPSPLQRVAAVADFGNGISAALPYDRYQFINPDLTIALHRLPRGEWVALEATTYPERLGTGTAESVLWDEHGRLGYAIQTVLLEAR